MPYNVRNSSLIIQCLLLIFSTLLWKQASAQAKGYTKPVLTAKIDEYRAAVKLDSSKRMVELKEKIPSIVYDLRYATVNNFMRRLMYPAGTTTTYLRLPAAIALGKVQAELQQLGYGLKVYDAYRPYSVTEKFWELVKDERYVANPSKGSGHNRGVAIDLTLINLSTMLELEMGTGFDNFSDSAHHSFRSLDKEILRNRKLLRQTMEKFGFAAYENEWWHYALPGSSRYEILDISFRKFKKEL